LVLRLSVGIALIYPGAGGLLGASRSLGSVVQDAIGTVGGALLLAGLWTPVAGALVALNEVWIGVFAQPDGRWNHIFLALLAASAAMVGPGAWSIDARLFGRKRFRMVSGTPGKKPPV